MPATATVKGGFWSQFGTTMTSIDGRNFLRRKIAGFLGEEGAMDRRAILATLNGVAPGANALKTKSRIQATTGDQGGKRVVETVNLINRATTAGDVTNELADLYSYSTKTTFGANPPANKDGNPLGTR